MPAAVSKTILFVLFGIPLKQYPIEVVSSLQSNIASRLMLLLNFWVATDFTGKMTAVSLSLNAGVLIWAGQWKGSRKRIQQLTAIFIGRIF
jgi:hypothetical protein